uniref:Secreted protein n=1 Tax=Ditylenchus dipsaci TaxID=166011 RepID=A0A915CR20_9BILA
MNLFLLLFAILLMYSDTGRMVNGQCCCDCEVVGPFGYTSSSNPFLSFDAWRAEKLAQQNAINSGITNPPVLPVSRTSTTTSTTTTTRATG